MGSQSAAPGASVTVQDEAGGLAADVGQVNTLSQRRNVLIPGQGPAARGERDSCWRLVRRRRPKQLMAADVALSNECDITKQLQSLCLHCWAWL